MLMMEVGWVGASSTGGHLQNVWRFFGDLLA